MSVVERFEHEGVEGIRVGRFNMGVSSTAVVYRFGTTIVDTGPPNQWRAVREFLQEKPIQHVLLTHHHEDHGGNGARIRRETGVPVLAPLGGIECMAQGFPLRPYQRIFWGKPRTFEPEAVPDEIDLGDGFRLRAITTPGHSPDMTCYLEPDRGWLFSGDVFIGVKPRYLRADEDLNTEVESLRYILRYDFDTVFCAHAGVAAKGREVIKKKLDYLESLRERARALQKEGRSVREITHALVGKEGPISWVTLYHFSKKNLIKGCLAT